MRPIRLTMTAFGPYKDVENVDFRELGDRNLFLVTGPTGAGKTTIFDAISFAIYGESSGNSRSAESLRSHFADDDRLTEVTLEFELRGRRYSVHRIPRQNKPKARGEGYTEQKADATLTIYEAGDDDVETVITGVKNVGDRLEAVLGINAEQFKQIMMIPQGEFQKMLTSGSEERQRVLQKLFNTRIYNEFQNRLELKAKAIFNEIRQKRELRDLEIARIACDGNDSLQELITAEDKAVDEIVRLTKSQVESDLLALESLKSEQTKLNNDMESVVSAREQAKEMNIALLELDRVKKRLAETIARGDSIKAAEQRIEGSEKALLVTPILKQLQKRQQEKSDKEARLTGLGAELAALEPEMKTAYGILEREHGPERVSERERAASEVNRLEAMSEKVERLGKVVLGIERLEKEVRALEEKKESGKRNHENLKTELENLKIRMDEMKTSLNEKDKDTYLLERYEGHLLELERLSSEMENISRMSDELEKVKLDYARSQEVLAIEERSLKQLRLDHLRQQASILALELQDDRPCPVCGSCQHPEPAVAPHSIITEEMIRLGEDAVRRAQEGGMAIRGQMDRLDESLRLSRLKAVDIQTAIDLQKEKTEVHTSEDLKKLIDELQTRLKNYTVLQKEIESAEGRNKKLIDAIALQDSMLTKTDEEIQAIRLRLVEGRTMLQAIHDEVPEPLRNQESLTKNLNDAIRMKKDLDAFLELARETHELLKGKWTALDTTCKNYAEDLKALHTDLESMNQEFENRLSLSGFSGIDDYLGAVLDETDIMRMKNECSEHHKMIHTLNEQAEGLMKKTEGAHAVDIATFEERLTALKAFQGDLSNRIGMKESALTTNRGILLTVERIGSEIGDQEASYAIIGNLSSVTKGNNAYRITFERYVLAAFLEDILKAANIRLSRMTGGRYALSRTEELQRSNAKGGLELEVYDNYTGKSRHVRTLSGGESFKASLSMALGLADIVQAYAGGVQLDTMFIDEGFGTLDQDSLDSAIDCLVDLQESGRLVGIISHVQELKERIDTRLEVTSTNNGSRTRFIVG